MAFRRSDLQEAFFVPGTHAFRVWGYSTTDPLEEVLRPGYFAASGLLHPGELVYARMQARADRRVPGREPEPVRMALLILVQDGVGGGATVRLVQDFGLTDDTDPADPVPASPTPPALPAAAAAPAPPPKRGRGCPLGSRSKKNGALAAAALN